MQLEQYCFFEKTKFKKKYIFIYIPIKKKFINKIKEKSFFFQQSLLDIFKSRKKKT